MQLKEWIGIGTNSEKKNFFKNQITLFFLSPTLLRLLTLVITLALRNTSGPHECLSDHLVRSISMIHMTHDNWIHRARKSSSWVGRLKLCFRQCIVRQCRGDGQLILGCIFRGIIIFIWKSLIGVAADSMKLFRLDNVTTRLPNLAYRRHLIFQCAQIVTLKTKNVNYLVQTSPLCRAGLFTKTKTPINKRKKIFKKFIIFQTI